jgi:hypothetical protein
MIFNAVALPVALPTVAVALTNAEPVKLEQRAVRAVPFWVTTEIEGEPFWEKVPKSAENATLVPSATATPFNVTIAWIKVQLPAGGLASPAKSAI